MRRSRGDRPTSGRLGEASLPDGRDKRGHMGLWRGRESGFLDAAYFAGIHLCEAETLAAKILQRGANEIKFSVVNDEEAVVEQFIVADGELRVLFTECPDVGIGELVMGYVLSVVML